MNSHYVFLARKNSKSKRQNPHHWPFRSIELKRRGVPAELEKWDGKKTIDIAVVEAKVNIEVDGGQHNYNSNQALVDLQRTLYSFKKGYLTLRIPNSLIKRDIQKTADLITEFCVESRDQLDEEYFYF